MAMTFAYVRTFAAPTVGSTRSASAVCWVARMDPDLGLTGFPWLFLGYAHLDTVLGGLAPLGACCLSASSAPCVRRLPWRRWRGRSRRRGRWSPSWRCAVRRGWGVGSCFARLGSTRQSREVALVQGDFIRLRNGSPRTARQFSTIPAAVGTVLACRSGGLAGSRADHVVAPGGRRAGGADRRGKAAGTALLLGIPAVERSPEGELAFHHAALALGTGRGHYMKRRLVPFGEYVPMEGLLRGLIDFFDLPMSHTGPGPRRQPLLDLAGDRGAMAICYEVVYPDSVRREAARADVMVTISNDSWFGQHRPISARRDGADAGPGEWPLDVARHQQRRHRGDRP